MSPGQAPADGQALQVWRHPKAQGSAGRCIGHTDLPVDPRKAKRVARRIQAFARRHGLARQVWTSDLQRSRSVGQWLARWGWRHEVRAELRESDFGAWDGRAWADIPVAEIDAWARDLAQVRPGGGESVAMLLQRVARAMQALPPQALVVSHGGWMCAARWLAQAAGPSVAAPALSAPVWPDAASWPAAPRHGQRWCLPRVGQAG